MVQVRKLLIVCSLQVNRTSAQLKLFLFSAAAASNYAHLTLSHNLSVNNNHIMGSCVQCGGPPKYKCPICFKPYCSVACCKKHKLLPCSAPPLLPETNISKESGINYEFPTEDTVPPEKLELLEKSEELKKCLENPHVRQILQELDKSVYPDELIKEYMQEPIFTELVDACLQVVEPPSDDKK